MLRCPGLPGFPDHLITCPCLIQSPERESPNPARAHHALRVRGGHATRPLGMLALGATACAWSGVGGAVRARPKLDQAHRTANDARLHTLRAARHAAPLAQAPALKDEKVLASVRAAGQGKQNGFTKNNDESASLDFVFRGQTSGEGPGSYVAGSIASQHYTGFCRL